MSLQQRVSRRRLLQAGLAAGGLLVAGCADEEPEASPASTVRGEGPRRGGTVRQASLTPILGLDPHTTEGVSLAPAFYGYVVHVTDWRGTVGDLAESWEVIDGLTWVFQLRGGVRFQDLPPAAGREVVAGDIVYSIDRVRSLPTAGQTWATYTEKYEAPDAATFSVRTRMPYGYLLMDLGSPLTAVVPGEAIEAFGDLKSNALGSGPFMLESYDGSEGVRIVRNPGYYRPGIPYVDGVQYKVMPDDASVQVAFRAGNLDVYNADSKLKADAVGDVSGVVVQPYLSRSYAVLEMNAARVEAFKDERVREAVDLSLDRQTMIDKLHFGGGELAGPVGPLWDSALPEEEVAAAYRRDVQKARQLLSAASAEGLRFKLSFASIGNWTDRAAIIQQNLGDAGIGVDLQAGELGAWLSDLLTGNFETTTYSHLPYLSDDIQLQSHHTYGWGRTPVAFKGIEDARVDALLDKVHETIDEEERIKVAQEAQRLILKRHGPVLVLYQPYGYWCAYDHLKGYTPTAYGFGLYKYDYWIDRG